ncbi:MAG: 2,3-bisphosphoglycerate-independent phosphoglycerate mutase [Candidatus Zixiibacteriota bacterium]|nr:MAG: 2,3-bisphosphoglycerate-independent phosphoglycerate mutase [candidate division Zixibacteria bacterium]
MLKKVILMVCDGLGDRPVKELGNLTPLEAAKTPNLDKLAAKAECGLMHTLGRGKTPGSDTAHLTIFGYPIDQCYSGRGPIEVAGLGLKLQGGDVALRGNFGTVGDNLIIKDRRAGRILEVEPLTRALDGMDVDGVKFIVKPGTAHRAGVIMRGKGLSGAIVDADPHVPDVPVRTVTATDDTPEAKRTADILNKFLLQAHEVLKKHPLNAEREKDGKLPANFLLVRGGGQYKELVHFKKKYDLTACCIAGGGLYKGVGAFLGMDIIDVPGATGLPDTDIEAKFKTVLQKLQEYDFVFVHVKAADSLSEDGNWEGKRDFIEKIDAAAALLTDLSAETLLVVTADHSTASEMKAHCADPVPIMFYGGGGESIRIDNVTAFNERACAAGGLGHIVGLDVMPQVQNLLGKLHLVGA